MSRFRQWIIILPLALCSSSGLSGGDEREHVHIKVHIPEVHRKHTHFKNIQKHHFHPKKVVKSPEYYASDLDMPFSMMSYTGPEHPQASPYPDFSMGLPTIPDIPNYGVDNTLESSVLKKPNLNAMVQYMRENMATKFHGVKRPSEFMGAHMADQVSKPSSAVEESVEEGYADDYDARSSEIIALDQRLAGTSHPFSMPMGVSMRPKWVAYPNLFDSSLKPYGGDIKWSGGMPSVDFSSGVFTSPGLQSGSMPPDWLSSTTEDDYPSYERFPSTTTMHIPKVKPLYSSRMKFDQPHYERDPYSDQWMIPKKKKSKIEKRTRPPTSGFRIKY